MNIVNILVPEIPESVADATVATWHKKPGDCVQLDEVVVEIETDKVIFEVPASQAGILDAIVEEAGSTVLSRQILGYIRTNEEPCKLSNKKKIANQDATVELCCASNLEKEKNDTLSPAVRRLISKNNLDVSTIKSHGIGGRITRKDVELKLANSKKSQNREAIIKTFAQQDLHYRHEKRVPMTRLRKRLADRLLEAKNSTAMLTTFNEINMQAIIDLRNRYGKVFEKRHGERLGFMSFCVKAVVEALKRYPEINASIDGTDVVYHNYFDISIAVSTSRGLVTPVLRNAGIMCMAEIETNIKELKVKSRAGKLTIEELTGGNFTITNSGIFGSLMSTPIINPPQSAILGMHAIKDRPMAVNGHVVIQPVMYLALSYDHRLIDGKESIGFLLNVKEILEDPVRLLLEV